VTKAQYRTALKKLGITTVVGASILGISKRQAQRYDADDKTPIPEPLAKLMRLMIKQGIKPEALE
jgi:hypothetical protein